MQYTPQPKGPVFNSSHFGEIEEFPTEITDQGRIFNHSNMAVHNESSNQFQSGFKKPQLFTQAGARNNRSSLEEKKVYLSEIGSQGEEEKAQAEKIEEQKPKKRKKIFKVLPAKESIGSAVSELSKKMTNKLFVSKDSGKLLKFLEAS